jgi:hypothetical protein
MLETATRTAMLSDGDRRRPLMMMSASPFITSASSKDQNGTSFRHVDGRDFDLDVLMFVSNIAEADVDRLSVDVDAIGIELCFDEIAELFPGHGRNNLMI